MNNRPISKVCVIGLGRMGRPIAGHLAGAGFEVTGYDVSPDATANAKGIAIAASPAEAAQRSDLAIVVVGFDSEVEDAVFGDDGLLAGAASGTVIAVASTVAPSTMKAISERSAGASVVFLDIPLCRGEDGAIEGRLLIMGGGDRETFEACRPAFATFANAVFHLGPLGAGQVGKMVNNMILWACTSADYEGLKLGEQLGVAPEVLRPALQASSAQNYAMEKEIYEGPHPWAEKDMRIVLQEAEKARTSLPLSGVVRETIKAFKVERGLPVPEEPST